MWLAYAVTIHGAELRVAASLMDSADPPQRLLHCRDEPNGWEVVSLLLNALERHEIRSLKRPIEAAEGPDGFMIA
jgi:hypothetical protein